jgi:hypothetical protein
VELALACAEARRFEIERQHGRGRPPVSFQAHQHQMVAVGSTLHWSKNWKTFPDFLLSHYYKLCFGKDWWLAQADKPRADWHPLFLWYVMACEHQKEQLTKSGGGIDIEATGAVHAVLWLAYGLYLLEHNLKIQHRLLQRLRTDDEAQIYAALYEVWITATMIWAGFDLALEDEGDGRNTHCEFTARSKASGKRYSVEAKVFRPGGTAGDGRDRLNRQLARALRKRADHERIIFVDLNEANPAALGGAEWLQRRAWTVRRQERALKDAPPASVFLTNYPYRHHLEETTGFPRAAIIEGFKLPGMKFDAQFPSLRAAGDFREQHADVFRLGEAIRDIQVPQTFDGRPPSRAFATENVVGRLLVGERYELPSPDGPVFGELMQGIVIEPEQAAMGIFRLDSGQYVTGQFPLSSAEVAAYRESPETFFGVPQEVSKRLETGLDAYEWVLAAYRHTPKARLLELLRSHPQFHELQHLPQQELAKAYAEAMAHSMAAGQPAPTEPA